MDAYCDSARHLLRAAGPPFPEARGARSQLDLLAVKPDFGAGRMNLFMFGRAFDQHRIGVVDMNIDQPLDTQRLECRERAVRAADRHVTHAPTGLGPGSGCDHLIIAPQSAIEEYEIGILEAGGGLAVDLGTAWNVE